MKPKKLLDQKAKWYGELPIDEEEEEEEKSPTTFKDKPKRVETKRVDCKLQFVINEERNNKKGRDPGFKIKGKGTDEGNEFKVKSEHKATDKSSFKDWDDCVFVMEGDPYEVKFDKFSIKTGKISGTGSDEQGNFIIVGELEEAQSKNDTSRKCKFDFTYPQNEKMKKSFKGEADLFRGLIEGTYTIFDGEEEN